MTITRKTFALSLLACAIGSAVNAQEQPPPPDEDYEVEGRPGFVIHYDSEQASRWETLDIRGLPQGLYQKPLSESPSMDANSLLTYVPEGWNHQTGYLNVDQELMLLEGDLTITDPEGTQKLSKFSFTYIPAGVAYSIDGSRQGAVLLQFIKGEPRFTASSRSKKNARTHAIVRDWNHYASPWYIDEPFPPYRKGGNFPGFVHKLVRLDPDSGEMTWMTFSASLPAVRKSVGNFGGGYEVHPSFEEYYFLEKAGDTTIGECLEQGLTQVTYSDRSYWWRPGGVGHGGPTSHGDGMPGYSVSFVRTGTQLWADYFTDCSYEGQIEYTGSGFKIVDRKNK